MSALSDTHTSNDELEIENRNQSSVVASTVYRYAEKFASTEIGQYAIKKTDRILYTIEKVSKWSVPQQKRSDKEIPTKLVRPLPWVFFLPALVVLRMVRSTLSMGSVFIGSDPILPSTIVHYMQMKRRKLRAIRYHGLRAMILANQKKGADKKRQKRPSFIVRLKNILYKSACLRQEFNEVEAIKIEKASDDERLQANSDAETKKTSRNSTLAPFDLKELLNKTFAESDLDGTFVISESDESLSSTNTDDDSTSEDELRRKLTKESQSKATQELKSQEPSNLPKPSKTPKTNNDAASQEQSTNNKEIQKSNNEIEKESKEPSPIQNGNTSVEDGQQQKSNNNHVSGKENNTNNNDGDDGKAIKRANSLHLEIPKGFYSYYGATINSSGVGNHHCDGEQYFSPIGSPTPNDDPTHNEFEEKICSHEIPNITVEHYQENKKPHSKPNYRSKDNNNRSSYKLDPSHQHHPQQYQRSNKNHHHFNKNKRFSQGGGAGGTAAGAPTTATTVTKINDSGSIKTVQSQHIHNGHHTQDNHNEPKQYYHPN